jgi:DNA repair protein SbcD/Mre11
MQMQPLRFLHSADLHLDSPFKGMSDVPENIRERVRESTFGALHKLVQLAVQEQVDIVLISGDVYDLADRSLRAQIRFQKALQELSSHHIPVFIIHGNHDPLDGRAAKLTLPPGCYIFGTEQVESIVVERPGRGIVARVHGISYRTSAVVDNLALKFKAVLENVGQSQPMYEIGMLHTNVDGDANHDNYAPCSKQDLLQSGMNYWALGHVHTRKVINGENQDEDVCIVYPGNMQGRSIRECGPRGCYIAEVSSNGRTKLAFHPLDNIRWFVETIRITGMETEQELKDAIEARMQELLQETDGRSCVVRFVLEGRGSVHDSLRKGTALQDLLAELRESDFAGSSQRGDAFIWPESIINQTGRAIDLEQLLSQRSFVGDMMRMSRELQLDDTALKQYSSEALSMLLSQPKAAKLLGADAADDDELRDLLQAAEELLIDILADGGWNG